MVPGLKTGRLNKRSLMTTETNSPAAVPLRSTVAPPPVVPLGSTSAPPPVVPSGSIGASSPDVTSPPFEDSDETQPPSETQNHVTSSEKCKLDFPKFYEDSHTSKKTNDWIHPKCGELHIVNLQVAATESGTSLTQEELSRQVLGKKKKYLLGFGIGPQPSTIAASRARDKDMEAMRAEIEALRVEQQKDREELIKEREERKKYYNDMLREREEREKYYNDMLKEREERKRCYNEMLQQRTQGQKDQEETDKKVDNLNNVVAKLTQLLGI